MNIVYTTDDNFIIQVTTSIVSVYENNKADVNIFVLLKNVSEFNKNVLKTTAEKYGHDINLIELESIDVYFGLPVNTGGWNDIVLSRLFLDKILPSEVERVIYIDGDTIVRDSLNDLWNINLNNNILGAVVEPVTSMKRKVQLGLEKEDPYYNAGILLIDLKKWKESNAGNRILNFYKAHNYKLFANDQDAINGELKGEIQPIDIKYNYNNTFYYYPYWFLKKKDNNLPSKDIYKDSISNPYVIHYLGEERPWREGNRHEYRNEYVNYYHMTYFGKEAKNKDGIIEYGWKKYFLFWNLFNTIIKPFPGLRLFIINKGIPIVMKMRSRTIQNV